MSKILIGESDGKPLKLDVNLLLTSRLLIQANSGGGKSYLLRRLAEQFYGQVQTILIDPEGEFYTLREKYGYVLVGEGGETPCDVRSAAMLAERFLDLKASAVCDLYEAFRSRPMDRRQWVRSFINALLDAPRSMWHPLVVIVDEAHKFCMEQMPKAGNQSDREIIGGCKDAMIALATTGRKRGFCPIWATQRLAKLDKDASAEMFNRMVGMTIEDVDVDRAADLMSVSKEDKHEFRNSLRTLTPGQFYCFGRAISNERKLVMVGDVFTHHPQTGIAARHETAPPMPDEVKKFLPQLADLPKEAEQKVRTVAELEKKVRDLSAELKRTQKAIPVPTITNAKIDPERDRKIAECAAKGAVVPFRKLLESFKRTAERVDKYLIAASADLGNITKADFPQEEAQVTSVSPVRVEPRPLPAKPTRTLPPSNGSGETSDLKSTPRKMLRGLAEFEAIGVETPTRGALASWCGIKATTGTFRNYLSDLRTRHLVTDMPGDKVKLTADGRDLAGTVEVPANTRELLARSKQIFGNTPGRMLEFIHGQGAEGVARQAVAEHLGISHETGTFRNYLSELRSASMITDLDRETVKCADWMFI